MLNDDLISAYLDGELDAERRATVEQHLRTDKGAAVRLARMRYADGVLRDVFPVLKQGSDDRLAALILRGDAPAKRSWLAPVAALAAAVVFGVSLGQSVRGGDSQPYAISAQEARLLDTQRSGRVTPTRAGMFEIVLSLRSEAGELCRQFRLTRDALSTDVLACRSGADAWRMVAAANAASVEGYAPAGVSSPLDAAIEALGPVEPLDAAQERDQIERGWLPLP